MPNTQAIRNKATSMMSGFSAGQRAVIAIAALTIVVGGVVFGTWASKPTMVPLYSNLSAGDASQITGKLQSAHVQYKLSDGGATILVPSSQVYQQRLNMAGAGLPNGGSDGYTLLDKQGITTSDFLEHVDYQRAVAGELEKTIESIQGVSAATVNLNIPQTDVFASDNQKPTASVLVSTTGSDAMGTQQVQSIVNLVAGAVDGLSPKDVTVADNQGRMLASPGQGITGGANDTQDKATTAVEGDLNQKIQALLTPLVGQGKAVVQANASLNFDKINQTTQVYNPNNKPATPTSQSTQTETFNNAGGPNATGCLGANIQVNSPACQAAATGAGGSGTYQTSNNTQDNAVDQTVTQTENTPGSINRVSVAVLLDSSVPVDTQQVTQLVTQAAGLQPARGDTVTVSSMPFDKTAAQATQKQLAQANKAKQAAQTMNLIKTVATVLIIGVVLGVLFFITKRRAANYSSTPISLAELDAAMPALPSAEDMLASMDAERELENSPDAIERAKIDKEITGLIERQPDEVAALLRSWLADRRS